MKYSIRSMDEVLREMAQSMEIEQNQPVMFSSPLYVEQQIEIRLGREYWQCRPSLKMPLRN